MNTDHLDNLTQLLCICLLYTSIEDGDKIAVGVSGGKDSLVLLNVLAELSRYYPKKFTVMGLTLDMRCV